MRKLSIPITIFALAAIGCDTTRPTGARAQAPTVRQGLDTVASDPRCRLTHYRLGEEILTVVYSDHDAFWERYPEMSPRALSCREDRLGGVDPSSLDWTSGLYDPAHDTIWIVGRFDRNWILRHEIAHRQEVIHGWGVGRWYWLRETYETGASSLHAEQYDRLCGEKAMALTLGWWTPAIVSEHTVEATLIDGAPPESGSVIEWSAVQP